MMPSATKKRVANDLLPFSNSSLDIASNHVSMPEELATMKQIFTFSPFGLSCRKCDKGLTIKLNHTWISRHLKIHGMDSRISTVHSLIEEYESQLKIHIH
jgi:hypothetical protein